MVWDTMFMNGVSQPHKPLFSWYGWYDHHPSEELQLLTLECQTQVWSCTFWQNCCDRCCDRCKRNCDARCMGHYKGHAKKTCFVTLHGFVLAKGGANCGIAKTSAVSGSRHPQNKAPTMWFSLAKPTHKCWHERLDGLFHTHMLKHTLANRILKIKDPCLSIFCFPFIIKFPKTQDKQKIKRLVRVTFFRWAIYVRWAVCTCYPHADEAGTQEHTTSNIRDI